MDRKEAANTLKIATLWKLLHTYTGEMISS